VGGGDLIAARLSSLKETKSHEYCLRFAFGGAATVLAGLVAQHYGPCPGGLFLAFPAIFPATATLIETHEKKRMAKMGHDGTNRGRMAASIDAAGAALGCFGLAGFAVVLLFLLPRQSAWLAMMAAISVWAVVSIALWELRRKCRLRLRSRLRRWGTNPR
jgi:hypothetical protein